VAEPTLLDPTALLPALAREWGGAEVELVEDRRLSAGASRISWSMDVRVGGEVRGLVVQRERARGLGRSEVVHEAGLLRAAVAAGVPVPEVVLADPDGKELGGAYIVTSRVDGETIPRRILRDPALAPARERFAAQCGEILARIHAIPADAVELTAIDPIEAIRKMLADTGQHRPSFELGLRWLSEHPPLARAPSVVHGDFRNGNLIIGADGVRAVLDWELAHLGNPVEDLGWLCCRAWRWGAPAPVGGMGEIADLLDAYRSAGGDEVSENELFWWQLLSAVRWGVMCLEQARVHLSGESRSVELAALGRLAVQMEYDVLEMIDRAP
jgi:aminoglycoside phosphotransferase (APT) family kinase protein